MLLQTEHLNLRAMEPEDCDLIYDWENDTTMWHINQATAPYSRFTISEFIKRAQLDIFESSNLRLMIDLRPLHQTIGAIDLINLDWHHQKAEIGIIIDEKLQNKGYAKEALDLLIDYALNFLNLHQLYVYINQNNIRSKQLFVRRGFEICGVLKDWIRAPYPSKGADYEDVILLQLVSKD